jgi:hypothetical protein
MHRLPCPRSLRPDIWTHLSLDLELPPDTPLHALRVAVAERHGGAVGVGDVRLYR